MIVETWNRAQLGCTPTRAPQHPCVHASKPALAAMVDRLSAQTTVPTRTSVPVRSTRKIELRCVTVMRIVSMAISCVATPVSRELPRPTVGAVWPCVSR